MFLLVLPKAGAIEGINQQINFQGRLLTSEGATVPDGFYNIEFKIYQDGDGQSIGNTTGSPAGVLKWTEDHLNADSQGVLIKNGYMSVQLGSVTPFGSNVDWNQEVLWLSMNIAGINESCTPFTNCSPDGEMTPMKRLSSTAFSLNSQLLGGLSSGQFLQLARGVQIDSTLNTNSLYVNKTGTGNLIQFQTNSIDSFAIDNIGDVLFGSNSSHSISIDDSSDGENGKNLTVAAGSALNGATGGNGGTLVLQGGNAGGPNNNNGGDVVISGGAPTGSGVKGLVKLSVAAYTANTNPTCSADCTINQSNIDNFGTVIIGASVTDITITLPPPTNTSVAGRILYITSSGTSSDFVLTTNSGLDAINVAMRKNTTATMIWNGSAWTAGGASNATTLQAAYDNGSNPSTTPEIKLNPTHGTIDIQDADTSINSDILNIRGSNAGNLGTVLFGVSSTGRVTIQGTTDQSSAFRVLNSSGEYLFNINSNNGYVVSNSVKSIGNEIPNSGFEGGGSVAGGEEGWFGSSQSSIANDSANANSGNYELQILPNGTNIDVYGGTFYRVEPGDNIYLEGYVKNNAAANGNAGIQVTWYNKDKTVTGYSTDYGSLPGTSYVLRRVSATVPSGSYYAKISATVRSNSNSGVFYFDDFYFKKSVESADYTYRNSSNSTSAFRVQSAGAAQTLFAADTSSNLIKIGDNTGSDTATTLLVLDSTTANPITSLSSKNGGLFYRSDTNSLKAIVGGSIVDICTTAVTCEGYSASASATIQLQSSSPGTAQIGHFNITGTGILSQLQTQDQSAPSTHSSNLVIRSGNATGSGSNSGNLVLDVGTATGIAGSITIGHSNVTTTMAGTLKVQGNNSLSLGSSGTNTGLILFYTSAGSNTVTLKAPAANPASSFSLTLPQQLGIAGDCLKDTGSGVLSFGDCSAGVTTTLQDVYDNSSPANTTLADNKNYMITAQQTTTSPSIIFNLQCTTNCGSNGTFSVQNGGSDVFTIKPNGAGIVLNTYTQIGSSTSDANQVNLQLDSYNGTSDYGACSNTVNQGAIYYNTSMGSIRGCINGAWSDVSNPDTLGLLTFGIVPSSGGTNNAYDLPSIIINGSSGPCKVSWSSNNSVYIQPCVAYSNGRRVNVAATTLYTNSATTNNTNLTTANRWGHVCLTGNNNQPAFTSTSGLLNATDSLPTFNATSPILCLADVQGSATTAGLIDNLYDVRTFTSTLKEAVAVGSAVELGMLVDAGATGSLTPAVALSNKMYGLVVASDGLTSSGAPNAIVATVGPGWVKAIAGTAGQFVKTSTTKGYSNTIASVPNNSFYYSAGNTRTNYSTVCTSSSDCSGSLYVYFLIR